MFMVGIVNLVFKSSSLAKFFKKSFLSEVPVDEEKLDKLKI